ncbi:leucine-rich repeat neuronal protein 3 [Diaphorina citri]|uniref:Leucine-rich repeat neuronal protein 3 n=1 Tax=Diaphorina citri TaxID=121845 RepID=A0A1S3DVM3_DIACI|nr:leucine-rich repeat neuronal protein 3 [Diaphorina citri]
MKNVCLLALLVFSCQATISSQLCPQHCTCSVESSLVECRDVHYREIGDHLPPDTTRLVLDNVSVDKLTGDTLTSTLATTLRQLIWRGSNIQVISNEFLTKLNNIEHLDLSQNQIQRLPNDAFTNNLNLKYLNMSHNQMSTIQPRAFDNLDQLKQLYLNANQLELREQVFQSLWNLEQLDLSYNKITMLDNYFFLPNKKLTHLYLNNNNIAHLAKQALVNMNLLKHLDLSYNSIKTLPSQLFQSMDQIEYLNISHNVIVSVINDSFSYMPHLKYLDVSSNVFTQLSDTTFSNNKKIEFLRIENTNIQNMKTELLEPLTNLVDLSVSYNPQLSDIDSEIFYHKPKLRNINLGHNALTRLPHSVTGLNLSLLDISENLWTCDCHMAWFAEWWSQNKAKIIPDKHVLFCKKTIYPDLINSAMIPTLRALNCTPAEITYFTATTYYLPQQNITLDCVVSGEPTPTITWLTPQGWTFHWIPEYSVSPLFKHHPVIHDVNMNPVHQSHLFLLHNGSLLISQFNREDRGNYSCFISNTFSNRTRLIPVKMDPVIIYYVKMESIAFGTLCAFIFLMMTLFIQLIIHCCKRCCHRDSQPKHIQHVLDNIDQCRAQQLSRLQENYALQVTKIKENYEFQAEKIRESYKDQVENLRTIKRNGTTHLVSLREQYSDQMMRVRDYSTGQLNWVRENYVFQRNRVRKFSAHQMLRIRENYKYQQQALNKMLESLPTLENCKSSCGYSMSTVYDETEIPGGSGNKRREDIPLGSMLVEAESHLSLYFTPPTEHSLSPSIPQPHARIHGVSSSDHVNATPSTAHHVLYTMMNPLERSQSNTLDMREKPGTSEACLYTSPHVTTTVHTDSEEII